MHRVRIPSESATIGAAITALTLVVTVPALAQETRHPRAAARAVYLDKTGVVRWSDDKSEVALFGANYVVTTASDYRAAGLRGRRPQEDDRRGHGPLRADGVGRDAGHVLGRLGGVGQRRQPDRERPPRPDGLPDRAGPRARHLPALQPDPALQLELARRDAERIPQTPGFGRVFGKERMGKDPAAIAAQVNYLRQILDHVNPYTGVAIKDEPAIVFIELVNEPWHHPEDMDGSIRYLNTLTDAVRSTGCRKLVFYNVSQDFRIGEAIRRSKVQGITFGWYPTGLNSGHELPGNHLRTVDTFPDMLRPELARLPRIVYEFDSPDLTTGTMYPAMARTFRAVGTQMALMFSYDMLATASRNLGWQTHYLNLVYTPRKAMSAVIAAEAMRRLPRMRSYGAYPENTRFGDFRVSADENLGELVARDAFLYTGIDALDPAGSRRRSPGSPASDRRRSWRTKGWGSTSSTTSRRASGDSRCIRTRCRCAIPSSRRTPTRS